MASVRPQRWGMLSSAERSLLIMLIGFAISVIATRWFLAFTGYPKIGGGDLHIAHALWGGALLFIGGLLPLVWTGKRVHDIAAGVVGIGMGLFIDEVGKFITTRNDYFYPAAAPIIYSTFLLATVLFLWVRRRRREGTPRGPAAEQVSAAELVGGRGHRRIGRRSLRALTIATLVLAGLGSLAALVFLTLAVVFVIPASDLPLLTLALMHVTADGVGGLLMLVGAGSLIAGRASLGVSIATAGLLVALSVADLLSFYLRQFDSIFVVLFHLGLLVAVHRLWRPDLPIPAQAAAHPRP